MLTSVLTYVFVSQIKDESVIVVPGGLAAAAAALVAPDPGRLRTLQEETQSRVSSQIFQGSRHPQLHMFNTGEFHGNRNLTNNSD